MIFFSNKEYNGLAIQWSGNIGFGEIVISTHRATGKTYCDDECMSKDFVMAVFEKLYDMINQEGK